MNDKPSTTEKIATIHSIIDTTYYDGSLWVEYLVGEHFGYEITYNDYKDNDPAALNEWSMERLINKPHVSVCSDYLARLIENTRQSDNEMWFVEYEDVNPNEADQLVEDLEKEVEKLGLQGYVTFHEDGCLITVFGGVITKFLF